VEKFTKELRSPIVNEIQRETVLDMLACLNSPWRKTFNERRRRGMW
jgi:hypothetical protein